MYYDALNSFSDNIQALKLYVDSVEEVFNDLG